MNRYFSWGFFGLLAGCSSQMDLGSGSNQDGLSDAEALCGRVSALPCGIAEAQCRDSLSEQDERAAERGCTGAVNAMYSCLRDVDFYCDSDGQPAADGCFDEQRAAGECVGGSEPACGSSSTSYEAKDQECSAFCEDGVRAECYGDQTAVTCSCQTGPRAGHTFALLSCQALDSVFRAECSDPPAQGNPEACGGTGTQLADGRQSCDASCENGVDVSCEGDAEGPVICECSGSGRQFALTGCDELPSRVPSACQ